MGEEIEEKAETGPIFNLLLFVFIANDIFFNTNYREFS